MSKPSPNPVLRRGFTLVELMVVVLLLGIMAGVAAPRYVQSLAHYRASGAAARVAADLRLAREHARRASVVQPVLFDLATESYTLTGMPDLNQPTATYAVALGSQYLADVVSANFNNTTTVQFDVYGRPNFVGSVVVSSGGVLRTIQVDAVGAIRVL